MKILDAKVTKADYSRDIDMIEATVTLRVTDALRQAPFTLRVPAFAPAELRGAPEALRAHLIGDALRRNCGRGDIQVTPVSITSHLRNGKPARVAM